MSLRTARAGAGRPCRVLSALCLWSGAWLQEPETPAATATEQEPQRVIQLTLEDALAIALKNNLDLQIERLATEEAHFTALGSWGAFDPVFSMTGTGSNQEFQGTSSLSGGEVVEDDSLNLDSSLSLPLRTGGSLDLTLNHSNVKTTNRFAAFDVSTTDVITVALTQPLLRGAWRRYATAEQRESRIAYERQLQREREVRAGMLLEVYNAYWDLVSAQELLHVREVAVQLGQEQLAQDRRRLEVGVGTEVDVLQAETNVAQQDELRLRADFDLRQARDNLRRALSPRPENDWQGFLDAWDWPIETLTPLPEVEPTVAPDWRASLERALQERPELAQRRLEIDTAEVVLVRARSQRLPQLDLNLTSSGVGFDADPNEAFDTALGWDFPSSSAALTFSLPIGNRSARYAERSARSSLRSAMLAYDRNELDVLADVRASVRDVYYRRLSVGAAGQSRDLAQRQLEAEQTRQEVGLSTTFQVLQFQEDLALAASTEVTARSAYAKALAKLAHSEGHLGDELQPRPSAEDRER